MRPPAPLFSLLIGLNDRSYRKGNPDLDLLNAANPGSGAGGEGVQSLPEHGEDDPPIVHTEEKPEHTSLFKNGPPSPVTNIPKVSSTISTSSIELKATNSLADVDVKPYEQFKG